MLEPDRSPIPSRILAARLALYAVGVGSVGFIVGYLAGGSASPVVSELLPLVFALVGGASGIAVAKADLTNLHDTARLAALGFEPRRDFRRLQTLRGWSYEDIESIFPGSPGACGPAGP